MTIDPQTILERLDEVANLKIGDRPPAWMPDNAWVEPLSDLAAAGRDRIEHLEAECDRKDTRFAWTIGIASAVIFILNALNVYGVRIP